MKIRAFHKLKRVLAFTLALLMTLQIPLTHLPMEVFAEEITTTTVSGTVSWEGDSEDTRPDSVTVKLLQNDAEVSSVDVTAENDWAFSFDNLDINDAEGNPYTYSVEEAEVSGYEIAYDGYNITNTLAVSDQSEEGGDEGQEEPVPATTSVSGTISWVNDTEDSRPDSVTVKLLQNDVEVNSVDVTVENGWAFSFNDLAVTDDEGNEYAYSVQGAEVEGYELSCDGNNISYTHSEDESDDTPADEPADEDAGGGSAEDDIAIIDESGDSTGTDNWELGVVFYDSTVDNGKTPLTAINWDASDGGYDKGETRIVIVQINYKNTNAITTYNTGDLTIKIPNIAYGLTNAQVDTSISIGANDSTHTGYDWNLINNGETLVFSNNIVFEELSNFEGSIQILYELTPISEKGYTDYPAIDEKYDDECTHEYSDSIVATLNEELAVSNKIVFAYTRTYVHPWRYSPNYLTKSAKTIASYDGINCENADDYIWVKYQFYFYEANTGLGINTKEVFIKDDFPTDCVVINNGNILEGNATDDTNILSYTVGSFKYDTHVSGHGNELNDYIPSYLYVGYPKDKYNEASGNLNITNYAELWGTYENKTEAEKLDDSEVSLNLADFEFEYIGELYGINKYGEKDDINSGYNPMYSNLMLDEDFIYAAEYSDLPTSASEWSLEATAIYTGNPMTVRVGDDLLYITDENGRYRRLEEDEYFYDYVHLPIIKNMNGTTIDYTKYPMYLYVKYEGEDEYEQYLDISAYVQTNEYKQDKKNGKISFIGDKKVVAFYYQFENLKESIVVHRKHPSYVYEISIHIKPLNNISTTGEIHNFGYIQVYFEDEDGNLILQNEPTIDSYANLITKEEIAAFDQNTYGNYMQRASDFRDYGYFEGEELELSVRTIKYMTEFVQNAKDEEFTGNATLNMEIAVDDSTIYDALENDVYLKNIYFDYLTEDTLLNQKIMLYDLLPKGMELTSTKEEIVDSLELYSTNAGVLSGMRKYFYNLDGTPAFSSINELENYIKEHASVQVEENWNDTGRTKITVLVDYGEDLLFLTGGYEFRVNYDYVVSYDSYLLYGSTWKNYVYGEGYYNDNKTRLSNDRSGRSCRDNGYYDADASDINENGRTDDYLSYSGDAVTINSVVSTNQDVQIQVQTDKSNYSTGTMNATPETNYSYKLRARTGANSVTNLVLINNLEEAYGSKANFWKGEFLGIDTSFAEGRTYKVHEPSNPKADANGYVNEKLNVKVYYSTSKNEGNLYQTELRTVTDDKGNIVYNSDGTELKMEVRIVDENGNFVKSANWLEYNNTVDKSTVKSLAFEFLNAETGEPAIIPANDLVYVEILMKAPVGTEGIDGTTIKYAYNNCFTQWNAIDDYEQVVDFITGMHSNIVRVSLMDKIPIVVDKIWDDNNDALGLRPDSIEIILKKDGVEVDRKTLSKNDSSVTFENIPLSELKFYTVDEECVHTYVKKDEPAYNDKTGHWEITNILADNVLNDISGIKTWIGDTEADRPKSITINLLQDGNKIASTTTNASKNWEYTFTDVLKYKKDGTEYQYSVEEESVENYITSYDFLTNGLVITFSNDCKTSSSSDYFYIYYKYEGKWYCSQKYYYSKAAGQTVEIPSKDFYIYWSSDNSYNDGYGFSIDSIEPKDVSTTLGFSESTFPVLLFTGWFEVSGDTYPETEHNPFNSSGAYQNLMWHYTSESMFDEPMTDAFHIINKFNLKKINGTKTWVGDTETDRPESITINLLQDGNKIASATTNASKNWEYSFDNVPVLKTDGTKYEYAVQEEDVNGYITSYGVPTNGLAITFSEKCSTYDSLDYLYIYYNYEGQLYRSSKYYGYGTSSTSLAGKTIEIPSKDFYIYWVSDEYNSRGYGFSIDSIEHKEVITNIGTTVSSLPTTTPIEVNGNIYPETNHFPYKNSQKALWHYTGNLENFAEPTTDVFELLNTYNLKDINGTKTWVGDAEADRPDSITLNLLQDGTKIASTTTNASKNWEYSFKVPILKADGTEYEYSVQEEVVEGYETTYGLPTNGLAVTFNSQFTTESVSLDYVEIYYKLDSNTYKLGRWGGTSLAGKTVEIPASDFYLYWRTDGSVCNKYGFSIDSIEPKDVEIPSSPTVGTIPSYTPEELTGTNYPDSAFGSYTHGNYGNNVNKVWHYTGTPVKNSEPQVGVFDIYNTKVETSFPLEFTKKDFLTGNAMGDVTFNLCRLTCENNDASHDHGKAGSTGCWESVSTGTSDADGKVSLDGLEKGNTYGVVETVPNGYALPSNLYWKVDVADDGVIAWTTVCGSAELDTFNNTYGWLGYSPDVTVKADGSFELDNIQEMRTVTATKRIKAEDINFANGNPTFLFKLTGTDFAGTERTYYREVVFTESYVTAHTNADGYVALSTVFDDVVAGNYVLSENTVSRYEFDSVSNISNGTANGQTVIFDLITNTSGSATYTNVVYEEQWFSHNDIKVNEIKKNKI